MSFLRVRRGGFTLVELMVVIAIITVLIAIGLPVMTRVREKTRQAVCIANLKQIQTALRLYRLDEGGYPGPYDPVTGQGGLNALYPSYVASRKVFVCPDDSIESGNAYGIQPAFQILKQYPTDPQATLIYRMGAMYDTQQEPIDPLTGRSPRVYHSWLNPTFFSENYSSYNLYYNWMGYIWWDPNPALPENQRYIAGGQGAENTGLQVLPWSSTIRQRVTWGEPVSYWVKWLSYDPENLLGLNSTALVTTTSNTRDFVDNWLHYYLAQQVYWQYYPKTDAAIYPFRAKDPVLGSLRYPLTDPLKRDLWSPATEEDVDPYNIGLPSGVFPGLINRNAPENTVVTRCPFHRDFTKRMDITLRLDGSVDMIPLPPYQEYNWAVQPRLGQ